MERISDLLSEEEIVKLRKEFGMLVDIVGIRRVRDIYDGEKRIRLMITFSIEVGHHEDSRKDSIAYALHKLEKKMLEVLSIRKIG